MCALNSGPDIFAYNDFRKFLSDYQVSRQKTDPSFSKSTFSRLLGLPNTRSYISDVIKGKRVTPEFVERFVNTMSLKGHEANYFRMLVKHNQCTNPDERMLYFEQLISLNRTPRRILEKDLFEYYKVWYHSVIRAMLHFYDFTDDYVSLAARLRPAITVRQARDSIKLLLKLRLIAADDHGFYRPTDKALSSPDFITDELVRQYQMQCFELAKRSIVEKNGCHAGQYITNTVSISASGFKVLENLVERFRSELRALAVKDDMPAENVYTVTLAVFATANKGESE